MLENVLERIAVALETLAGAGGLPVSLSMSTPPAGETGSGSTEDKKPRGRPRKEKETTAETPKEPPAKPAESKPKEEPKAPVEPADDFLDAEPAKPKKPPTLDEVRAALKAYATKWVDGKQPGTSGARALMGKVSAGAVRLSAQPELEGGTTGVLPVEHYAGVIEACSV